MTSPESGLPGDTDGAERGLGSLYAAASEQWVHAEQMRWTIFYNFLVGNTILLVSWSTLFVALLSHRDSVVLRGVLTGACVVGFAGGIVWTLIQDRANQFSESFFKIGRSLEEQLSPGGGRLTGPFAGIHPVREHPNWIKSHRILGYIRVSQRA